VKTLKAVVNAKQENQTRSLGGSFMRKRHLSRVNLAPERPTRQFSHSQDPYRTLCAQMSGDDLRLQKESMSFGATSI
jgi:hypothetical protein